MTGKEDELSKLPISTQRLKLERDKLINQNLDIKADILQKLTNTSPIARWAQSLIGIGMGFITLPTVRHIQDKINFWQYYIPLLLVGLFLSSIGMFKWFRDSEKRNRIFTIGYQQIIREMGLDEKSLEYQRMRLKWVEKTIKWILKREIFLLRPSWEKYIVEGIVHKDLIDKFKHNDYYVPPDAYITRGDTKYWWIGKKKNGETKQRRKIKKKKKEKISHVKYSIKLDKEFVTIYIGKKKLYESKIKKWIIPLICIGVVIIILLKIHL